MENMIKDSEGNFFNLEKEKHEGQLLTNLGKASVDIPYPDADNIILSEDDIINKFNAFNDAVSNLLDYYKIQSINEISHDEFRDDCKRYVYGALQRLITNGQMDLVFDSKIFKMVESYDHEISGQLLADNLHYLLRNKNIEQARSLLQDKSFSKHLNKLDESSIVPMAKFIADIKMDPDRYNLAYNDYEVDEEKFINEMLQDNNEKFRTTLHKWAHTKVEPQDRICVYNSHENAEVDLRNTIQDVLKYSKHCDTVRKAAQNQAQTNHQDSLGKGGRNNPRKKFETPLAAALKRAKKESDKVNER